MVFQLIINNLCSLSSNLEKIQYLFISNNHYKICVLCRISWLPTHQVLGKLLGVVSANFRLRCLSKNIQQIYNQIYGQIHQNHTTFPLMGHTLITLAHKGTQLVSKSEQNANLVKHGFCHQFFLLMQEFYYSENTVIK